MSEIQKMSTLQTQELRCAGCGKPESKAMAGSYKGDVGDSRFFGYCEECEHSRKHGPCLVFFRGGGMPNHRKLSWYMQKNKAQKVFNAVDFEAWAWESKHHGICVGLVYDGFMRYFILEELRSQIKPEHQKYFSQVESLLELNSQVDVDMHRDDMDAAIARLTNA